MGIEIEKKDLQRIVEMAFVGYHIMIELFEDDKKAEEYNETLQTFYEGIVESGGDEFIHHDDELGVYIESEFIERKAFVDILDAYDEKVFTSMLPHQLAMKDALLEYASKTNYNLANFYQRVKDLEEAYDDEFEAHGLERLGIIETIEDEDEEFEHQIYI
jgi:hypothetical protein